ncbi:Ras GTPase-activating-like protein IQGAP1 [Merluccius polli]|uniref:Ras GTPase-activating-like protein IQGAP1 n=1 Tax=Merluccius polli TaxID=89951 RepID=A0AA47NC76_MERPO|nr:Ras GTPase-activating-like protein IQGAP1 [Merluccius polli]
MVLRRAMGGVTGSLANQILRITVGVAIGSHPIRGWRDFSNSDDERLTADEMDQQRIQNVAYQYLCRLEEAKRWMEACLGEELPAPTDLEEGLRNGVWLAKLAHHFSPKTTPLRKIYDSDQNRYKAQGLQFRHTDNINHWRNAMVQVGLPTIFHPETTDIYDRKNMPRAVYCIHALSMYLFRLGLAPQIHDLYGKVQFTEEEIDNMKLELDKYGIQMPSFSKIGGLLANELSVDQAAVHAAVLAINEAVVRGDVGATAQALRNPNAMLEHLQGALVAVYQEMLQQARTAKAHRAAAGCSRAEKDMYEEYLSQTEIQDNINKVNVRSAVEMVDEALESGQEVALLSALQLPALDMQGLRVEHSPWYLEQLTSARQHSLEQGCVDPLEPEELQQSINLANQEALCSSNMQDAVRCINEALQRADSRQTLRCLLNSDAMLPDVLPFAAALYHQQLQLLQRQHPQGELQQEELYIAVEMLSAVAMVNQALEAKDLRSFCCSLRSPTAGLSDIHDDLLHRYLEELVGLKSRTGRGLLTWNQLQEGITSVNIIAEEDQQRFLVLELLQQALEGGDPGEVLSALLLPSSGVEDVVPANASRYLHLLTHAQRLKAQRSGDPAAELSLADVQEAVRRANQQTQRALKGALALAAVNQAVKEGRADQTLRVLRLPEMALEGVASECSAAYQKQLSSLLCIKAQRGDSRSPWVRSQTADGVFYFHISRLEGSWDKPHGFTHNALFLTNQEIQGVVSSVSRRRCWEENEELLVLLQARSRGFLLRQRLSSRLLYLRSQGAAATTIQSHWRRFVQQRAYRQRVQFLYQHWRAAVKVMPLIPPTKQQLQGEMRNKVDELQANVKCIPEYKNACVIALTETWLKEHDLGQDLEIDGFGQPIRLDRDTQLTGKTQGGGVCLYVNPRWCKTIIIRESICSPHIELLSISLRPFYLPREIPQLVITLVYIHPRANSADAAAEITKLVHRLQSISPDAPYFILGDFNTCSLKKHLGHFYQYVSCPTRHGKILDLCYGTVKDAYKSYAMSPLGSSDHSCIFLAPIYQSALKRGKVERREVSVWTYGAIKELNGCFHSTNWDVFKDSCTDLDKLTFTVSSYIRFL